MASHLLLNNLRGYAGDQWHMDEGRYTEKCSHTISTRQWSVRLDHRMLSKRLKLIFSWYESIYTACSMPFA